MLLTVPQVEHDRALRRAHLANCGRPGPDGATRVRVAAAGFGAAAVLAVATAMSPAASDDPVQPDPARQSPLESGTNGGNIGGTIGGVGVVNQLGVTSQP